MTARTASLIALVLLTPFELARLPAESGDLVVRLKVASNVPLLRAREREVVLGREGEPGIRIGEVIGIDANGERATGALHWSDDELTLSLPVASVDRAALPLVVDPWITPPRSSPASRATPPPTTASTWPTSPGPIATSPHGPWTVPAVRGGRPRRGGSWTATARRPATSSPSSASCSRRPEDRSDQDGRMRRRQPLVPAPRGELALPGQELRAQWLVAAPGGGLLPDATAGIAGSLSNRLAITVQ